MGEQRALNSFHDFLRNSTILYTLTTLPVTWIKEQVNPSVTKLENHYKALLKKIDTQPEKETHSEEERDLVQTLSSAEFPFAEIRKQAIEILSTVRRTCANFLFTHSFAITLEEPKWTTIKIKFRMRQSKTDSWNLIDAPSTFLGLFDHIKEHLKSSGDNTELRLFYKDKDGDLIRFSSQREYLYSIKYSAKPQVLHVEATQVIIESRESPTPRYPEWEDKIPRISYTSSVDLDSDTPVNPNQLLPSDSPLVPSSPIRAPESSARQGKKSTERTASQPSSPKPASDVKHEYDTDAPVDPPRRPSQSSTTPSKHQQKDPSKPAPNLTPLFHPRTPIKNFETLEELIKRKQREGVNIAFLNAYSAKSHGSSQNRVSSHLKRGKKAMGIFVEHVTVPDETIIKRGEAFLKLWKLENHSVNPWPSGSMLTPVGANCNLLQSPEKIAINDDHLPAPGVWCIVGTVFTAPTEPGIYMSYWRMSDSRHTSFGERIRVKIKVI